MCQYVGTSENKKEIIAVEVRAVTHRQFSEAWVIRFTAKRILLKLLQLDDQC